MNRFFCSFFAVLVYSSAFAQWPCIPQVNMPEPGLAPESEDLECFINNEPVDAVITFKNFDNVMGVQVNSLRIDSITNLPCGSVYALDREDRTYGPNEKGCIKVYGTTNDVEGQYKLGIYITVSTALPQPISGEASEIIDALAPTSGLDFSYYVRVKDNVSAICASVDTTDANNLAAACDENDATSISEKAEVLDFTFSTDPAAVVASVQYTSTQAEKMLVNILDVSGKVFISQHVSSLPGSIHLELDISSLPSGLYLLSISNGQELSIHKFSIIR